MNQNNTSVVGSKLLLRGIHVSLTDAMRINIEEKTNKLLRHEEQIVRVRIDIEHDQTHGVGARYIAKGHIEIAGPDLIASVATEDAYKSVDLLIDKLDRQLRKRATAKQSRRHKDAPLAELAAD